MLAACIDLLSPDEWFPWTVGLLLQIKKMDSLKKSSNDLMEAGQAREALQDIHNALAVDPRHSLFNIELHMMACKAHVALAEGRAAVTACDQVSPLLLTRAEQPDAANGDGVPFRSEWCCDDIVCAWFAAFQVLQMNDRMGDAWVYKSKECGCAVGPIAASLRCRLRSRNPRVRD